jgi:hypothetical protein
MALTYKEDLNNYPKSIAAFEELNSKYPDNKYKLSTYYQLYLLYQKVGNTTKSNEYKEKILNQYPNSEYAQLIKNPNYIINKQNQLNETEQKYETLYNAYLSQNFNQCYQLSQEMIQSGLSDKLLQKVEFFKAVCGGKLKGLDTLEMNLKKYIALYPKSELKDRANELLLAINKLKTQKTDTTSQKEEKAASTQYTLDANALHYFIIVLPDEPKMVSNVKSKIDAFNKNYYSNDEFSITSNIFTQGKQIILVKSFGNSEKAKQYFNNFVNDEEILNDFPKNEFEFFIISDENYKTLIKEKNLNDYKSFFELNYKKNGKS